MCVFWGCAGRMGVTGQGDGCALVSKKGELTPGPQLCSWRSRGKLPLPDWLDGEASLVGRLSPHLSALRALAPTNGQDSGVPGLRTLLLPR